MAVQNEIHWKVSAGTPAELHEEDLGSFPQASAPVTASLAAVGVGILVAAGTFAIAEAVG
ncbi:hypothetical protein ACF9IK_09250 [Kitasatospora hibisci]|uniref:hypothetical protein n=1 Tax=Kitasatospora hibisci TaxID=3369522 RepID=UPI00375427A0